MITCGPRVWVKTHLNKYKGREEVGWYSERRGKERRRGDDESKIVGTHAECLWQSSSPSVFDPESNYSFS